MRSLARRLGWALLGLTGLLIATTVLTARSGDPRLWPPDAGSPTVEIFVVSHGYHSGLALPSATIAEAANAKGHAALGSVARRFAQFPWIEVG